LISYSALQNWRKLYFPTVVKKFEVLLRFNLRERKPWLLRTMIRFYPAEEMKIKDLLAGGLFVGWLQETASRPCLDGRGESNFQRTGLAKP
jgi:hypothetical protein